MLILMVAIIIIFISFDISKEKENIISSLAIFFCLFVCYLLWKHFLRWDTIIWLMSLVIWSFLKIWSGYLSCYNVKAAVYFCFVLFLFIFFYLFISILQYKNKNNVINCIYDDVIIIAIQKSIVKWMVDTSIFQYGYCR